MDGGGGAEIEGPEGEVVPVRAEVAHGAGAEIPPAVPLWAGEIDVMIRAIRRRAEPEVPIDVVGGRHGFGGTGGEGDDVFVALGGFGGLVAPGAGDPDVDGAHGTDGACADELDDAAEVFGGVDLNAHLGGDVGLFSE